VAEVNANNSKARAHDKPAEHQIVFRKMLAKQMMENSITESGGVRNSPIRARRRSMDSDELSHRLVKKPNFTGRYDASNKEWTTSTQEYLKQKCKTCPREVRTYCTCNKGALMCSDCFASHMCSVGVDHAI
jgi:hypothetical protein